MMVRRCASLGEKTSSKRCCAATGRGIGVAMRLAAATTATCGDLSRYGTRGLTRRASRRRRMGQRTRCPLQYRLRSLQHRMFASAAGDDDHSVAESSISTSETTQPTDATPVDVHQEVEVTSSKEVKKMTWSELMPQWWRSFWSTSPSALYLRECLTLLKRNLLTLMSLTALNSGARFALVWTLYKTVCAVAVQGFGIPPESIPHEMIPNPASTSGDPNVYQQLADITFLVFKPFDFLLKGIFIAAALLVCQESLQNATSPSSSKRRFWWFWAVWNGFSKCFTSSWESLGRSPRYIVVYVIMSGMTAFYQGLCFLIVPLLFAIKKLMNIQLGLCVALLQGKKWRDALAESEAIVEPSNRDAAFPDRLFIDIPEITWGLIALTTAMAFLIDRMAEVFPLVIYSLARDPTKKIQNEMSPPAMNQNPH